MARLHQIVIDCHDAPFLARFWSAAFDEFEIRAYDDAELARLAALGLTPDTDPSVILDGPHVEICFQAVDRPALSTTPVHLDLQTGDRANEVERMVQLGASVAEQFAAHTWMRDPEGNDFCVVDA